MDHEVDELESAQLSFIIACRLVPRVLPGYPDERPTEAKRRFVDVWIGSSEFVFRRAIGSFQFFHHTGATACLVRVTGKVQGVWYRGWVCDEAVRREL